MARSCARHANAFCVFKALDGNDRVEASGLAATGLRSGELMFSPPNCLSSVTLPLQNTTKLPPFHLRLLNSWTALKILVIGLNS